MSEVISGEAWCEEKLCNVLRLNISYYKHVFNFAHPKCNHEENLSNIRLTYMMIYTNMYDGGSGVHN